MPYAALRSAGGLRCRFGALRAAWLCLNRSAQSIHRWAIRFHVALLCGSRESLAICWQSATCLRNSSAGFICSGPRRRSSGRAHFASIVTALLLGMLGEAQPAEGELPPGHPFFQVEGSCGKAKAFARPLLVGVYIHGHRPRTTLALLPGVSMIGHIPNQVPYRRFQRKNAADRKLDCLTRADPPRRDGRGRHRSGDHGGDPARPCRRRSPFRLGSLVRPHRYRACSAPVRGQNACGTGNRGSQEGRRRHPRPGVAQRVSPGLGRRPQPLGRAAQAT